MGQVLISEEYLQSMADTIRQKTGTTDPITPSNFANVMEEYIPDPPTPPEPTPEHTQYGGLRVYSYHYDLGFDEMSTQNCEPTVDAETWATYAQTHGIVVGTSREDGAVQLSFDTSYESYRLYWDSWSTGGSYNQDFMNLEELTSETGIDLHPTAGSTYGSATLCQSLVLDKTQPTTTIILQTANDFYGLYGNGDGDWTYTVNGQSIPANAIKEFYFGSEELTLTYNDRENMQYGFLCGARNLSYCSPLPDWCVWEENAWNQIGCHFYNCFSLEALDISNATFPASIRTNVLTNLPALKSLTVGDCVVPAPGDQWATGYLLTYYPSTIDFEGYPHDETTPIRLYGNQAGNWLSTYPNRMPGGSGDWRYMVVANE